MWPSSASRKGPYSHAYERCYEVWVRIELGQLDKAAEIVVQLKADAKRHGFDFWALMATCAGNRSQRASGAFRPASPTRPSFRPTSR